MGNAKRNAISAKKPRRKPHPYPNTFTSCQQGRLKGAGIERPDGLRITTVGELFDWCRCRGLYVAAGYYPTGGAFGLVGKEAAGTAILLPNALFKAAMQAMRLLNKSRPSTE